jgi:EF-hand domain-containing family member B
LREPLFKGYERKYAWPEQVENKENFPFGLPTQHCERVKELVNPNDRIIGQNPAGIEEMYKKTHGNFAPGEQKAREYKWDIDVTKHRFGYGEKPQINGAAISLH